MLAKYNLPNDVVLELLEYINENLDNLYTISLRTMIKLAEVYRLNPTGWRDDADAAFIRNL
jgi:hypothetical protein